MLENALFGIDSLLADAELGERSASAHNDIGIPAPLVYFAFVAVHLRAVGNVDLDDLAVIDLDMLEFQGDGHVEGVGVVDDIEDVSRDGKHLGWIDARERAVVLYAEQDSAAERVGERADGFEEILFRLVAATLEFDAVVLALFDNVSQLMRVHGDHPFRNRAMARLWHDYGAIGAIMARFLEHAGADATTADLPAVEERAFRADAYRDSVHLPHAFAE